MRWILAVVLLLAPAAWAQRVVILQIDGDAADQLRLQIERAVKRAGVVELVPLGTFREAAARKRLRGGAAMTAAGVAKVGKRLKLDAAVGGEVSGGRYEVAIYDRAGAQLWAKSLALHRGLLSDDFAQKLARAIAAAAETGAQHSAAGVGSDDGDDDSAGSGGDTGGDQGGDTGGDSAGGDATGPGLDLTNNGGGDQRRVVGPPDHDPDLDPDRPQRAARGPAVQVPLVSFGVAGATTWRAQCLRPGVSSCKAYDTANPKPDGIVIDFTASVPYMGFDLTLDLFPFARFDSRWAKGFGLLGEFGYGASLTKIVEETPQGAGPATPVNSVDLSWRLEATWRFLFLMGAGDQKGTGFVGLRGGLQGREFNIDPNAGVSLPSSQRVSPTGLGFPVVGFDASLPIANFFRIDVGASYFVAPKPALEQIIGYGDPTSPQYGGGVDSTGWSVEAGFSGQLWGPLGWRLRLEHQSYADQYHGPGQKWTVCNDQQCGGAAEESFTTIYWGLTGSY